MNTIIELMERLQHDLNLHVEFITSESDHGVIGILQ
jgi:hypothetical protein